MAGDTPPQDARAQAAATIQKGNADFRVVSAGPSVNESQMYVVSVPMAVMRSGPFGWISRAITSTWGKPTKFGDDLFYTLRNLDGVEPSLNNDMPHIMIIHVENSKAGTPPQGGFYYSSRGLGADACEAIEMVILRNHGPIQRFAEWLRRLF